MLNQVSRTQLLLGKEGMDALVGAKVAIFGIGGVGGYVVEALARSGVGSFVIVDDDKPSIISINTDLLSPQKAENKIKITTKAVGESKLTYFYMIFKDGIIDYTSTGYTDNNSLEWIPSTAGNYTINCVVSDEAGNMTVKSINYVITNKEANNELKIKELKTNYGTTLSINKPVKLMASATGKGTLKYKFSVYKNGNKQVFSNKSTTARYAFWTPQGKGSYLIVCKVTDSTGKEVRAAMKVTVK